MSDVRTRVQIAFHRPSISDAEIAAVTAVLRSGWLTTGTQAASFEAEFAAYTGARHAISVNSCTAGLHLALLALGVGRGDEVITTPYTFAATGETIIHCGARPVLVDVEAECPNIDPEKIARAITPRTRAIVPVHIAGDPCRLDEINRLAARHNLGVVEDAAHALGSSCYGRRIGGISTVTVFSFYATKNLTTGEGGMVTTHSDELARRIRQLSLHGLSRDAWNRYTAAGSWRYEICEPGWKYNLSDLQAAIGRVQLARFETLQRRRRRLVRAYREGLQECSGLILPRESEHSQHAWHLFIIRLRPEGDEEEPWVNPAAAYPAAAANLTANSAAVTAPAAAADPTSAGNLAANSAAVTAPAAAANTAALPALMQRRDRLIEQLRAAGIGTSVHFIPLHLHRCYQQMFGYRAGDFPNAERFYAAAVTLPLYPGLRPGEVEYICRTVRRLLGERRFHPVTEGVVAS